MENNFKNKIAKGFSLLTKTLKAQPSLYLSVLLSAVLFIPIINRDQNIYTNLLASLIFTLLALMVDSGFKYRNFSKLEGTYDSYLYESEGGPTLRVEPIGVYTVHYEGGYQILIKKIESLRVGMEKYLWEGHAVIPDVNIGTMYWQYTSPKKYKDLVGYKRIIIFGENSEKIKIYMLGEGGVGTPRETLIKRSNN